MLQSIIEIEVRPWSIAKVLPTLILLTFSARAEPAATDVHWQIVGPTTEEVRAGRPYALQNLFNKDLLTYGHQRWGINLRNVKPDPKDGSSKNNFIFSRQDGSVGALTYGERLSVKVMKGKKDGDFLQYTHRDVGPNLGWSKERKFEWELRGGKCGEKVKTQTPLALYSIVEKDYLIYCSRPLSVNLRWLRDKESTGCHGLVKTAAKKAVEKGTVAACGYYGGASGAAACKEAGVDKKAGAMVSRGGGSVVNRSSLVGCE